MAKTLKVLPSSFFNCLVGALWLLSPLAVQAQSQNPNAPHNQAEPGWSLWRSQAEAVKADFDAGFSNLELGGYLDFENACKTDAGSDTEIKYWFRLSNSVQRLGTGLVESGCWFGGRFLHTYRSTAIKASLHNVNCLRVDTQNKKSLVIRQEPRVNSRRLGIVANGRIVKPDSFPASIVEVDGENWIAIASPKEGWISDGSLASSGNLRLCSAKKR
ncbi:hypothetical protein H6G41_15440 [Tolypothrix sp. FACHB-123]|uniref:hypothetical protein n=1 Tax=Tolypothrix sp. FACHB-123 TaxID=2692868 RepID=UPI0016859A49|nr:hypothetical protein [Tolypothrix sp. FACHB-123]MBD2355999.1 hypothetical protein [Tolypothrix sp. FACHB-123]